MLWTRKGVPHSQKNAQEHKSISRHSLTAQESQNTDVSGEKPSSECCQTAHWSVTLTRQHNEAQQVRQLAEASVLRFPRGIKKMLQTCWALKSPSDAVIKYAEKVLNSWVVLQVRTFFQRFQLKFNIQLHRTLSQVSAAWVSASNCLL